MLSRLLDCLFDSAALPNRNRNRNEEKSNRILFLFDSRQFRFLFHFPTHKQRPISNCSIVPFENYICWQKMLLLNSKQAKQFASFTKIISLAARWTSKQNDFDLIGTTWCWLPIIIFNDNWLIWWATRTQTIFPKIELNSYFRCSNWRVVFRCEEQKRWLVFSSSNHSLKW